MYLCVDTCIGSCVVSNLKYGYNLEYFEIIYRNYDLKYRVNINYINMYNNTY